MNTVIVIATYGDQFIYPLMDSLKYTPHHIEIIHTEDGGYATGAYLRAYREFPADYYMFMHDSMLVKDPNFTDRFHEKLVETRNTVPVGVVPWINFPIQFDTPDQEQYVKDIYKTDDIPSKGIFGPIFYTSHKNLEILESKGLLPPIPNTRWEEQANERAWSVAFHLAGLAKNPIHEGIDSGKLDRDEYELLTKFRPGRP